MPQIDNDREKLNVGASRLFRNQGFTGHGQSQFCCSLLLFLFLKLSFLPLERDQLFLRRFKEAVARCLCQLT